MTNQQSPKIGSSAAAAARPLRSDGLSREAIVSNVEAALAASLGSGASPADLSARMRAATSRDAEFAEKYPQLLEIACSATTPEAADTVRHFLTLMMSQVDDVEMGVGAATFDAASVIVGQAVADRYLPTTAK